MFITARTEGGQGANLKSYCWQSLCRRRLHSPRHTASRNARIDSSDDIRIARIPDATPSGCVAPVLPAPDSLPSDKTLPSLPPTLGGSACAASEMPSPASLPASAGAWSRYFNKPSEFQPPLPLPSRSHPGGFIARFVLFLSENPLLPIFFIFFCGVSRGERRPRRRGVPGARTTRDGGQLAIGRCPGDQGASRHPAVTRMVDLRG